MAAEPIGALSVEIVGDYSTLQAAIDNSTQIAEAGASKIAAAFTEAGQQMDLFGTNASSTLSEVNDQLSLFDVNGIEAVDSAFGSLAVSASDAVSPVRESGASIAEAGDEAQDASGKMEGLGESLAHIAELMGVGLGIAEGIETLKELATESVEAAGKLQMAEVALTTFSGSAEKATAVLESMKSLAASSIFSFPDLAAAAQKMAALGISAEQIPSIMRAVAASAEATGNSMDTVASAIDRVYLTGTLSTRQLATLGISLQDMANVGGVAADTVKQKFQELGTGSAEGLNVLTQAITTKVGPAFENMKDTVPVAINEVKVAWDSMLEDFGKAVAPDVSQILAALKELLVPLGEVSAAIAEIAAQQFAELIAAFKGLGDAIGTALVPFQGIKDIFDKIDLKGFAADLVNQIGHWRDIADVVNMAVIAYDKMTGNTKGAEEAAVRLAQAHGLLSAATKETTTATNAASDAVNFLSTAHQKGTSHAQSYAAAMKDIGDELKTVPTYAETIQKSMDDIDTKIKIQNATLQTAIDTYKGFAATGTATSQELADAWKKVVTDAQAAGIALQPIKDALDADLASSKGLQAVIVDGHTVWVQAAHDSQDYGDAVGRAQADMDDASGSASNLTGNIVQLRGAVDQQSQSVGDLSQAWIFENGQWTTAADAIAALKPQVEGLTGDMAALADATSSAASATDGLNAAQSSGGGGGKGGGGNSSLAALIAAGIAIAIDPTGASSGPGPNYGSPKQGLMANPTYGFAAGGDVSGGVPILVGENGPEIFTPPSDGSIIPNDKIGKGSQRQYGADTFTSPYVGSGDAGVPPFSTLVVNGQTVLVPNENLAAVQQALEAGIRNTNTLTEVAISGDIPLPSTNTQTFSAVQSLGDLSTLSINGHTILVPANNLGDVQAALAEGVSNINTLTNIALHGGSPLPSTNATATGPVAQAGAMGDLSTLSINGKTILVPANNLDAVQRALAAGVNNINTLTNVALYGDVPLPSTNAQSFTTINPRTGLPEIPSAPSAPSYGLPSAQIGNYNGPGGSPGITINLSGATIYGQQGADMVGSAITNALRVNASLLKF